MASIQGYGLLLESSVTFLMLCWTQTRCWSSSCSLRARSSSSAFRSISLSAISLVLQPGPTPLKHKRVAFSQADNSHIQTQAEINCCPPFLVWKEDRCCCTGERPQTLMEVLMPDHRFQRTQGFGRRLLFQTETKPDPKPVTCYGNEWSRAELTAAIQLQGKVHTNLF